MTTREIVMELLKKWVDAEVNLMWEYSTNFDESRNEIWRQAQIYCNKLEVDDFDYVEELKDKIFH